MTNDALKSDESVDIVIAGLVDTVFGGLITNGLGVFSDKLEDFRLKQGLKLRAKLETEFKARGITKPKAIQPKILVPLLEEATLEDDDELQSRYANLLANASDPNYKGNIQRSFVTILAGLEPIDVAVLDFVFEECQSGRREFGEQFSIETLLKFLDFPEEDISLGVENIIRNGLFVWGPEIGTLLTNFKLERASFKITRLGQAFTEAMQSGDKKSRTDAFAELQDLGQKYEAI